MQEAVITEDITSSNPQVMQYQKEMFDHCRKTFESFQGLGDVAEDMRILSLNAELAAGRAGSYGVSIRALTQYTRELVNRLEQINLEMQKIESFQEMTQIEGSSEETSEEGEEKPSLDASEESETSDETAGSESGLPMLSDVDVAAAIQKFQNANGGVKYLNEQAKRIAEVVSQSNSIATNMAIEAATAGQYEETFTNVANDMRGFVDTLKNMVTRAQDSIEKAFRAEKGIKEIEASIN